MNIHEIPTPAVVIDRTLLEHRIQAAQQFCTENGFKYRPHAKTHKMVPVARMQLAAGAEGLTVAKLSEAEALLPSGVRRIFVAHSIVQSSAIRRLQSLHAQLDELTLAVTSPLHAAALDSVLSAAGLCLPVWLAVDCGLDREGVRTVEAATDAAELINGSRNMILTGLYTHEGHAYVALPHEVSALVCFAMERLLAAQTAIGPGLQLWPGCSVTAPRYAGVSGITGLRHGACVFGDLNLSVRHPVMQLSEVALTVLATVVDKPRPGLALLDAGTKTLGTDKLPNGVLALPLGIDARVEVANEEHAWLSGADVDGLPIGSRVRLVPTHVCPVVNLANAVFVTQGETIVNEWPVDARGCVT